MNDVTVPGKRVVRPIASAIDRLTALLLALAVGVLLAIVAAPPPASAAGSSCSGAPGNFFDGFYYNPAVYPIYYFEGASGYIVVRDGALCPGDSSLNNFTTSWVMLAAWQPHHGVGWAQVGFERDPGLPLRWMSQNVSYNQGCGGTCIDTRYSTFDIGSEFGKRHTFRVLWNSGCRCLQDIIDVTIWSQTSFNPFNDAQSDWGPQPFSPQFSGETGYPADDITGYSNGHTSYTALGAQQVSNDQLVPMPCAMTARTDSSRWGRSASRCDAFDIWTATP